MSTSRIKLSYNMVFVATELQFTDQQRNLLATLPGRRMTAVLDVETKPFFDLSTLGIENPFRPRYDNFIGGKLVPPVEGRYFANVSPVVGQPFTEVARSSAADIELALDAARDAAAEHLAVQRFERASGADHHV